MVAIHFRLSERGTIEVQLESPETWENVLQQCKSSHQIDTQGIMVVRNGKVLTAGDIVRDDDIIDVFPAISGG